MLSWRATRHLSGTLAATALAVGVLVPAPAQADGMEVSVGAPSTAAAPAAAPARPAQVTQKSIPSTEPAERQPAPRRLAADSTVVAELDADELAPFSMLGVTWEGGLRDADTHVEVRWRSEGTWSDWTELHADPAPEEGGRSGTEPQWVGTADGAQVRVASTSDAAPRGLALSTIDPAAPADDTDDATGTAVDPAANVTPVASAAKPGIISRSKWGASSTGSCDSPIYGSTTRGAVIHHTAGNNTYTKAQSAAIVKATQAYHMKSRKWCDIGYNFLVDKYGQIFEGRAGGVTKPVRAAHSGNLAVNKETMGISLMGTFSTTQPSAAMKTAVVDLVSWRFAQFKLKAKGTYSLGGLTLNRIAGHRNVVGTECPGNAAYAWLSAKDGLRDRVEDTLAGTASPAPAPAVPPAVEGVKVTPTTDSAAISWRAVDGAKSYGVCLVTSATSTTCARSVSKLTTTSTTVKDLTPTGGRDYYVKVRAGNGDVAGPWSAQVGFDLVAAAPAVPKAVTGIKVTPTASSAAISWTAAAGAKSYGVCLVTSAKSTSCARSVSKLTTTSTTVKDLKPTAGRDYYVKVRAGNGTVAGPWSTLKGFDLVTKSTSSSAGRTTSTDVLKVTGTSFTLTGHGFGHGIGMSQYGAQGAAKDGVAYSKILSTYYPGTDLATRTGTMRVLISKDTTAAVTVAGRSGLTFRQIGGSSLALPTTVGGKTVERWQIRPGAVNAKRSALQYRTDGTWATYKSRTWTGDAQLEAPTLKLVLPDGSTATYRTALRSSVPTAGSTDRNTVNVLPLEHYVRGVVAAEMPSSWSAEALKAQAVAARTYGVRGLVPSRYYDMCDTTSCQVYRGKSGETTATNAAVSATEGKIVTYDGKPALTQYSSSSGGWTAPGSQAYLTAVKDPYDDWSGNANHDWKVTAKIATLQNAYPKLGSITKMTVKSRVGGGDWGGRVSTVTLTGSKSSATISGPTMRMTLGLKSAWFRFN
ncbi:MAG: hypothetical protein JWP56_875 [Aeromicrobium sp.]|jgi:SpoIID/LytB domain protein|nr:hypothetical protein [Aeromicrobium sp.]